MSELNAASKIDTSTVHVKGDLDVLTADDVRVEVVRLIDSGCREITVDLAEVTTLDQAAARMLAALQHDLATHDGQLQLAHVPDAVREVLHLAQVSIPAAETTDD